MGTDSDFSGAVQYRDAVFLEADRRKNTSDAALETFRRFLSCRDSVPRTLKAALEAFQKMRQKLNVEDLTGLLEQHPRLAHVYSEVAARRKGGKRSKKAKLKLPLQRAVPKQKTAARPAAKAQAGRRRS